MSCVTNRACGYQGGREQRQVRVLFDGGSHRSFITSGAAQRAQLAVIRQEYGGLSLS